MAKDEGKMDVERFVMRMRRMITGFGGGPKRENDRKGRRRKGGSRRGR